METWVGFAWFDTPANTVIMLAGEIGSVSGVGSLNPKIVYEAFRKSLVWKLSPILARCCLHPEPRHNTPTRGSGFYGNGQFVDKNKDEPRELISVNQCRLVFFDLKNEQKGTLICTNLR